MYSYRKFTKSPCIRLLAQVQRLAALTPIVQTERSDGCWKYRPTGRRTVDGSWKRLFFERRLAELIESFIPRLNDIDDLERQAAVGGQFIRRLDIGQMMPPIYRAAKMPRVADPSPSKKQQVQASTAAAGLCFRAKLLQLCEELRLQARHRRHIHSFV
jgi:hypothetical protein